MGRSEKRIHLFKEDIYVTNFKSSELSENQGEDAEKSLYLKNLFEKYSRMLQKTPVGTVSIDFFRAEQEERFRSVAAVGKTLLLPDTSDRNSYSLNDPNLLNYSSTVNESVSAAMDRYLSARISSELIIPILVQDGESGRKPLAYIHVVAAEQHFTKETAGELESIAVEISQNIEEWSREKISQRFIVSDLSQNGIGFEIPSAVSKDNLSRFRKYAFKLTLPNQRPFILEGTLRWWAKSENGNMNVGLKLERKDRDEIEKHRFDISIKHLEKLLDKSDSHLTESGARSRTSDKMNSSSSLLYIDPDPYFSKRANELFKNEELMIIFADSLTEGLVQCAKWSPAVVVTEIESDKIHVIDYLKALRKISPGSLIITYSKMEHTTLSLSSFNWIWAQLLKKKQEKQLLESVKNALSWYKEKIRNYQSVLLDEKNLSGEIDWLLWKDYQRNSDQMTVGKNILNSISHSSSQGIGLGSLLTYLDLAEFALKKDGTDCLIPKDLMKSILENKNMMRSWTEKLDKLKSLFDLKVVPETLDIVEVQSIVNKTIADLHQTAKIKNNHIIFMDKRLEYKVKCNRKFLTFSIKEILVNAMKFSPEHSKIQIIMYPEGSMLNIDIINEIEVDKSGIRGIPKQYSERLFEPFFRMNHTYDERFQEADFGFGIGLNLVQNLAKQIDNIVRISEIKDYSSAELANKIATEIQLPILSRRGEPNITEEDISRTHIVNSSQRD
ncbi:PF07614 family protein [Leptospira fainei serovar Hurstbridge str. BUT 6]|uniref:PF07614 family protein n=1 Tax=Leptospira fainei serovar Hurstbridge str. BUT 6 TaxID=1193011 RepID=S3V648_9LEPT|nr:DUF1577 domain-containing protein [Leptospira fainei]EPG76129.1 PF07614 family protein [Leptospira fainei serovar Hurstbridge str. BUT 6]